MESGDDDRYIGLPALEMPCKNCKGTGGHTDRDYVWTCPECHGSGDVPTEIGEKILSLVRHNFGPMLKDASEG